MILNHGGKDAHLQQGERSPKVQLFYLGCIIVFLALSTYCFRAVFSHYLNHLARSNRISLSARLIRLFDPIAVAFLLVQLLLVIGASRLPGRNPQPWHPWLLMSRINRRQATWGAAFGLFVFLAGLPLLLAVDQDLGIGGLFANEFFSLRTAFLAAMIFLVVPVATEIVFREIIFKGLCETTNLAIAILVSSLLFAYTWSVFDAGLGFVLGLTTAFLYYRYQNLLPSLIANIVATVCSTITVMIWTLHHP